MQPTPYPYAPPPPDTAGHLRLLSIFYYIFAGLGVLGLLAMAAYAGLMAVMFSSPEFNGAGQSAAELQTAKTILYATFAVGGLLSVAFIALYFFVGRWLVQRRNWTAIMVVACLTCLSIPFGTALGIFTIIVINRPDARAMFGRA